MENKITFKINKVELLKPDTIGYEYAIVISRENGNSSIRGKALVGEEVGITEEELQGTEA